MTIIPFHVVLVAAGSSTRMGHGTPKQHRKLVGRTPVERCVATLRTCPGLQKLVIVGDLPEPIAGVINISGGNERFNSVFKGLQALNDVNSDDVVLIHDSARPLASATLIASVVEATQAGRAATLYLPVADTLLGPDGPVARDGLKRIQTPQGFRYGDILQAHTLARTQNLSPTDDAQLMDLLKIPVTYVPGAQTNFKLTTPDDWMLAEQILGAARETRTATGYDVHAFDPAENVSGTVRLGGIDIPHAQKLLGFSDADVVLHALCDALYGCVGAGDIGFHFPPGKSENKDRDSAVFLKHAVDLVRAQGGVITHLDATILCEAPKIGPYRDAMRERIAQIAGIETGRVSIKATTTEGLGFTGRREGIAAHATATITLPAAP